MRRVLLAVTLCTFLAPFVAAQQTDADKPATKADIEKYLEVTHTRENMNQIWELVTKQTRQLMHDQLAKNAANLPPDSEARMNKSLDAMLSDFPFEEMLQAMIPVYQKHWTEADVNALVAFYSSPTGQKILKDMPATMKEAMQAVMPIVQKRVAEINQRVQQDVAQMVKDSQTKPGDKSPASPN